MHYVVCATDVKLWKIYPHLIFLMVATKQTDIWSGVAVTNSFKSNINLGCLTSLTNKTYDIKL